jgi:nucleoside-diphosphate-sugar epimerase
MIISNKLDTKYIILRLSNIVGTGHFYKKDILRLLPNNICKSIKKSNTAILKSSGKQYRNFLSVYELVNILFLILKNKKISSGIYNVGGKNMSVISLVKKISYYISQHTKIKNVIKTESKIPKISRKLHFSSKKINTLLKIKSKNKTLKNTIINIYQKL